VKGAFYGFLALVVVILLGLLGMRTVGYENVKVVTSFGQLTGRVLDPGLNFITPFIQGTKKFTVINRSFEASDQPKESSANYKDYPVSGNTSDGQQVTVNFTVLFSIDRSRIIETAKAWGTQDGILENVVKANVRAIIRGIVQQYTADQLYTGDGFLAFQKEIKEELTVKYDAGGVILYDFLLKKVGFAPEYIDAIENQQIAKEGIETAEYLSKAAEFKRNEAITMAEADAKKTELNAQAEARNIVIVAEAEAKAIESKGMALKKYPEMLQWQFVSNMGDVAWGILPGESVNMFLPAPVTVNP
jgi:regulator of protease activity HflC (stomatin/prohibitin superfamily)